MTSWDVLTVILGHTSMAVLALFLLDRAHRDAYAKMSQLYEQQLDAQKRDTP